MTAGSSGSGPRRQCAGLAPEPGSRPAGPALSQAPKPGDAFRWRGARACGSHPHAREVPGPRSLGTTALPRGASLGWERPTGSRMGRRRDKAMSRTGADAQKEVGIANQETRPREQKSPRNRLAGVRACERRLAGAPRGAARFARDARDVRDGCACRRSAPSDFCPGAKACPRESGEKAAAYPAPIKNTGGGACLLSYPSPEGEGRSKRSEDRGGVGAEKTSHPARFARAPSPCRGGIKSNPSRPFDI